MSEERKEDLTPEELEREDGEPLPDREAMTVIDPSRWHMPPMPTEEPGYTTPIEPPSTS